jgi:predicted 2-oxoglutarate/Fe(II)-dependent dioxygenase YbiX
MTYQSYKLHNPEPWYVTAENAVTPEEAAKLISLVDERGSHSGWDDNPYTFEYQLANPFSKTERNVDDKDMEVLPTLFQLAHSFMGHLNRSMRDTVCETVTGYHGFWIMKYHEGAEFCLHSDWGTGSGSIQPPVVATLGIKLNDDFEGGEFCIGGKKIDIPTCGLIMHDGYTQHKVTEVTKGTRYKLVIHFVGAIK